jgi:surface protein
MLQLVMQKNHPHRIQALDKLNLISIIRLETARLGNTCSLNHVQVSGITDMSELFKGMEFNGDISAWDTSSVTSMRFMFQDSSFNGNISTWDTSNVTDMGWMFYGSQFNHDISHWNVQNVHCMRGMFARSRFNGDISLWKPTKLFLLSCLFEEATAFVGDLRSWQLNARDLEEAFGITLPDYLAARRSLEEHDSLQIMTGGSSVRDRQRKTL